MAHPVDRSAPAEPAAVAEQDAGLGLGHIIPWRFSAARMPAVTASRSRADLALLDRDGVLEIAMISSKARTKTVSSGFIYPSR
jgi:hypothetical protein